MEPVVVFLFEPCYAFFLLFFLFILFFSFFFLFFIFYFIIFFNALKKQQQNAGAGGGRWAGRWQRGRSEGTPLPAGPRRHPSVPVGPRRSPEHPRASPGAAGPYAAALPHVCSPRGCLREKEDERGRGAPSAFPSFQGSSEPLREIIGRNWGWMRRRCLAPLDRLYV